ncbi:hypothetical protein A2Z63_00735 [Candidatus Giovannonibacteria bacterium RIFCSPLOWO2_02_44_8]|uniref:Uncharacterized protein n=1 Tax=Candidatus Giovannonibacteria bacterium RIFCSPLOWO2_02_44_8 TaxID=1798355 RepID=A0A1F5XB27_9BACT|nr:MAG: hypothetical protein A2Z63_00735 [Candidatus Giovannonibacteria bacterium RIFCSPLOWO2_02_44_8]
MIISESVLVKLKSFLFPSAQYNDAAIKARPSRDAASTKLLASSWANSQCFSDNILLAFLRSSHL